MNILPITKETSNTSVPKDLDVQNIRFINIKEKHFKIHGLLWDDENGFIRMPQEIAATDKLENLNQMDTGGRVTFRTNSRYIAIKVLYNKSCWFAEGMSSVGACGFDLYEKTEKGKYIFLKSFLPINRNTEGYCTVVDLFKSKERNLIINFPIFAGVMDMYIGIDEKGTLQEGARYSHETPVVFYGSSITHGAFASRPGISYPSMLSMKYDFEYTNLGYSGACRGQKEIVEYISTLDMSVFVLDYDHNAPNVEHLEKTHYYVYETIRKAHPDIPIIMASRPTYDRGEYNEKKRRNIICSSYEKALQNGDNKVYFVDGRKKFKNFYRNGYVVDGTHPNDVGFEIMARAFSECFDDIYKQ